jgi:cytidylate kinase
MSSKEDPIDFRTLHGLPGEGLEALARHLAEMLNLTVTSSGRGADEGRDLFFDDLKLQRQENGTCFILVLKRAA